MSQVVVDTDVISFLFKNHPIGSRYDPELAGRIPLVSFMTVADWNDGRFNANGIHNAFIGCIFTCGDSRSYRPAPTYVAVGRR